MSALPIAGGRTPAGPWKGPATTARRARRRRTTPLRWEPASTPSPALAGACHPGAHGLADSLFQRIAAGDERAVKSALDRFGGLVWSLARRLTPSPADAEDAVQEIFISLWKSAGRYDPARASEATFVATIARRRLIDRLRASGARPRTEALEAAETLSSGGSERIEAAVDLGRVEQVLGTLREDQRRVIELAVVRGLSHSQIAEHTGIALGTVKTHVRRGLQRVREALAPEEEAS